MASSSLDKRLHSFLASGSSHDGHLGAFFSGFGSFLFNGRFPGLPSSSLTAVGFGGLPLPAITFTPFIYCKEKGTFI
jgi:hypothetical protein